MEAHSLGAGFDSELRLIPSGCFWKYLQFEASLNRKQQSTLFACGECYVWYQDRNRYISDNSGGYIIWVGHPRVLD